MSGHELVSEKLATTPPRSSAPVDLPQLLSEVEGFYRRFLATLSDAHFAVLATWTAHTYVADLAYATPYLHVTSPEKLSGKTRLLEVANYITYRPRFYLNVSGAVIYRELDSGIARTLLLDEIDHFLNAGKVDSESRRDVLGLLNGGYTRATGTVGRVLNPRSDEIKHYKVYGPKLLCGLGDLHDTLASRSLRFSMRRRAPGETVERLRERRVRPSGDQLRGRLEQWATDDETRAALDGCEPEMPEALTDRMQDSCEQLVAIADLAGAGWPLRLREALVAVTEQSSATESLGIRLLTAVHDVWENTEGQHISTADLLASLNGDDESSWGSWNEGDGMRARDLSKHVKAYGIRPSVVRIGEKTARGYSRADFEDAFARYLRPESVTSVTTAETSQISASEVRNTEGACYASGEPLIPHEQAVVTGVTDSGTQRRGNLLAGDNGFALQADAAFAAGDITELELADLLKLDRYIRRGAGASA